ncbi:putative methyltransferase NSUN6 isoform X3 [Acyrthosiphon pisum]|uniref:SAM-dependent MTase RsmB/NOP-type domain-containing protein n=1 Tax=Acyrthosiphon pisum TaxID=7029 RepID=A0A8R2FAY0_ACYPI|nr:putative methyltransferase NSUN6 isoform X3 [Acyrthosiphon pisum]|eukprot:XP_008186878.1 PREDICTED: putative methyltransferase NSUN6 isoform X3 [Acyrthosiphon pisum]
MMRQAQVVRPHNLDEYVLNLLKSIYKTRNLSVEEVSQWLTSAPLNSYFRVNTLKITPLEVMTSINEQISNLKRLKNIEKKQHSVRVHKHLSDCIVISPMDKSLLDLSPKKEEVIVDIATGQSVLRGSHIFAPGIMAMAPEVQVDSFISVYADLAKGCKRGYQKYYDNPMKMFVGNGIAKMNRRQLFNGDMNPKGIAVEMTDPATGIPSFTLPNEYGMLQNLPSVVTGHALDVNENNLKVLDMCAAPGNKTTHIAILMNNKGSIDAVDKSKTKLNKVELRCKHFGIQNVKIHHFDSLAINLVKPGGILVYSTCTITLEENEHNVAWVLEKFPQMELIAINSEIGSPGIATQDGLNKDLCEFVRRFGPENAEEDSIGFFISKFQKRVQ